MENIINKNNWFTNRINQQQNSIILIGILFCCFIYRLFYFKFGIYHVSYNSDSVTYFANIDIFNGIINKYRTPVYLYVVKFFEYLSREHFIRNIILFQHGISFLSIILFYYVSKKIIKNKFITVITTVFYGCCPLIINQNININPECLTIVGSTLILFLFVRYVDKPSRVNAFFLGIFPLILIMLKPTYLILLCIVLIFLIFRFILFSKEKIFIYWGFIGLFISVISVVGYCEMNKKYNGEFVFTKVSLNNSLANIVISGAYKLGEDKELITLIDTTEQKGFYVPVFLINNETIDNYTICNSNFPKYLSPTNDMIFCSSLSNTENYSAERINNFVKKSQYSMIYITYILKQIIKIFLYYKFLSLILVLQSIAGFYVFFMRKTVVWKHAFSILFILGQFLTIAIGGIDSWSRLLIPSYPFILLVIASFIENLMTSFDKNKLIDSIYE